MHQKEFYLEIIFPAKLWQSFTYKPLDNNQKKYFPGQRILVPLRNRSVIGFVDRIHTHKPIYNVRKITEIIDTSPIFPQELYTFLEKLADYYITPFGQVLDSALPSEIKMQKFRTFFPVPDNIYTGVHSTLYNFICNNSGVKLSTLKSNFDKKSLSKALNDLKVQNFIVERPDFSAVDMKKKIHRIIKLHNADLISDIKSNAKRQIEILEHLAEKGCIEEDDIKNFSTTAIKSLQEKEIISIEKQDVTIDKIIDELHLKQKEIKLNNEQENAYKKISANFDSNQYKGFLLHGVTGSGKTEVYIKLIAKALEQNKSTIVLVPEIALTTHLASRFYGAFNKNVAIWHSNLSSVERSNIWHKLATRRNPHCHWRP